MEFTYEGYKGLIDAIVDNGYEISDYHADVSDKKTCILRHDVDFSVEKAVTFAEYEKKISPDLKSTYFVLLSGDFYNVFSSRILRQLKKIINMGHEIGLHFDETAYDGLDKDEMVLKILFEKKILSELLEEEVTVVSMHRPSKWVLEENLKIPEMINSYSEKYFKEYKYLSDSRRRWREPVDEIIASRKYKKLHILLHPFWYNEEEIDLYDSLLSFIDAGNSDRYYLMDANFTELGSVIEVETITKND